MNNLDLATVELNNIFQQHLQVIAPTRSLLDWNQKKLQNLYLHAQLPATKNEIDEYLQKCQDEKGQQYRVSVESKVSNHLFTCTGWVCQNHVKLPQQSFESFFTEAIAKNTIKQVWECNPFSKSLANYFEEIFTTEILGGIYQNYSDIFDRITPGIYLFNIENYDLLRERMLPKQGIINVNG